MPQCRRCGATIAEDATYCGQCWESLSTGSPPNGQSAGRSRGERGAAGRQRSVAGQQRGRAGQQHNAAGQQPGAVNRAGGGRPAGQPAQGTQRRDLLKYGGAAAVLAGGAWLAVDGGLLGGSGSTGSIDEDFEDGSVDGGPAIRTRSR